MRVLVLTCALLHLCNAQSNFCTFAGFDLSALNGTTYKFPDRDQPNTYQYYVSICANIAKQCDDITAGARESGNVYQMGSPQTEVLCWTVASVWNLAAITAIPTNNGLILKSANGDTCKGSPRRTTMNLICNRTAALPTGNGYQDPNDPCHFIIHFQTKIVCVGPPVPPPTPHPGKCSFAGFDLSSLKGQTITVPDRNNSQSYSYSVSVCGNLAKKCTDLTTGHVESGNVYQIGGGGNSGTCWFVSSTWDNTVEGIDNGHGLSLVTKNGDTCKGKNRETVINLTCKPGSSIVIGYGYEDWNDACRIIIDLYTGAVCK